jgi:peptidoglycan/xylan/chitin deacetylase (PgdA/CDA1 family)
MTPVPSPLPVFSTTYLRPEVHVVDYLSSPCAYLERRWAPDASVPGTVVLPVMFHSIAQPGAPEPSDPKDMSYEDFQEFMAYARREGWQTITIPQLLAFLQYNAPIPRYSLLMIIDDRRPGVVEEYFMPLLIDYDWTLTLAYIANPDEMQWAMRRIEELNQSGHLDVQSHGLTGELYILPETSDEAITHEILGSTAVLEAHFGKRPLAFIWPGGNFTARAVQIAREGEYKLGFTAYSRGPLMFNWVPQGEPELAIHDPLMLLPRAWSRTMPSNLYQARQISQEALADALARYPEEANYYRIYCGGELPKP